MAIQPIRPRVSRGSLIS
jgi:hypothetical protein